MAIIKTKKYGQIKKLKSSNLNSDSTGAACFKSIGFASCADGITKSQADTIASRLNASVTFHIGKSCAEITCKP